MACAADLHELTSNLASPGSAQRPELAVGDEAAGEFEEGLMHVNPAFPADAQTPEAVTTWAQICPAR